jgi:hypothetical protein
MKKLFPLILLITTLYSCSKNIPAVPVIDTNGVSYWTFKDSTHLSFDTYFMYGNLMGQDTSENGIVVQFLTSPLTNGNYVVTEGWESYSPVPACDINVNGIKYDYGSTGKQGDSVNVLLSGDSVIVTFSNITVTSDNNFNTGTGLVSGKLIVLQ